MEIDFIEIAGKKCIQSTYHGSKSGQCSVKGCYALNDLNNFIKSGNYKKIDFEAQLNQDGTFDLIINGQDTNINNKLLHNGKNIPLSTTTKNQILTNSKNNPAVLVFSIWSAKPNDPSAWYPGYNKNCKGYNNAIITDTIEISDVVVSSKSGKLDKVKTIKFPYIENSCIPTPIIKECNWINKIACKNNQQSCCNSCR